MKTAFKSMRSIVLLSFALAVALSSCEMITEYASGPPPLEYQAADYFPLNEGDIYVYQSWSNHGREIPIDFESGDSLIFDALDTITIRVAGERSFSDKTYRECIMSRSKPDFFGETSIFYRVDGQQVYKFEGNDVLYLDFSKTAQAQNIFEPIFTSSFTVHRTFSGAGLPAGIFDDCLEMRTPFFSDREIFAKGVGLIYRELTFGVQDKLISASVGGRSFP